MTGKGKRKARAVASERPLKRIDVTILPSDPSDSEYTGEEDVGRAESQDMLAIAEMAKRFTKEDPFFEQTRDEIAADEAELQKLVDEKEKDIIHRDISFNSQLRTLLTSVLTRSAPHTKSTVRVTKNRRVITTDTEEEGTAALAIDPRPGYDHSTLLFAKGESMLRMYKRADTAISYFKSVEELKENCGKEMAEVGRLILVGEEVAKRRIEDVLQKPEPSRTVAPKSTKKESNIKDMEISGKGEAAAQFLEAEVKEIESIFAGLRRRRDEDDRQEGDIEEDDKFERQINRTGFFPLLHDIERGAKRFTKHLQVDAAAVD